MTGEMASLTTATLLPLDKLTTFDSESQFQLRDRLFGSP
jgi:hypothetical protein